MRWSRPSRAIVRTGSRAWVLSCRSRAALRRPGGARALALRQRDIGSAMQRPRTATTASSAAPTRTSCGIAAAGGQVVDPTTRFLDASGTHYVASADGVPLYADSHHLTTAGARLKLLPCCADALPTGDRAPAGANRPNRCRRDP